MSISTIKLTRRRILASLMVISLAGAAAGAGTMALFSDTEQSTGNVVQAGTLDLTTAGDSGDTEAIVNVGPVAPGASGTKMINVTNVGSLNGSLDVNIGDAAFEEANFVEPETDTNGTGDLNVNVTVYVSSNQTVDAGDTQVASGSLTSIENTSHNTNFSLSSGEEAYIIVEYTVPTSNGNAAQGDSVYFSLEAELNQKDSQ